jgi:tetratricopeptide (TPR) repeat protein
VPRQFGAREANDRVEPAMLSAILPVELIVVRSICSAMSSKCRRHLLSRAGGLRAEQKTGRACPMLFYARHSALRAALAVLMLFGAVHARAEVATDCFSEDWERRIAGCSAIIEDPATQPQELVQALAMRALTLSIKGQYERAIEDYDAAIRFAPDFAVALNNRAWAYYKWGQPAKGLADVEKSLRINPLSEHTWDTRGHIRQLTGNHAGAFSDYEQAINIGGQRMIKLYQCGLSAAGLYKGRMDGAYNDELRSALKQCADRNDCDPLPADEECRDPVS